MRRLWAFIVFLLAGCMTVPSAPTDSPSPTTSAHGSAAAAPEVQSWTLDLTATAANPWTGRLLLPALLDPHVVESVDAEAYTQLTVTISECGAVSWPGLFAVGGSHQLGSPCSHLEPGDHTVTVETVGVFAGRIELSGKVAA